jgi:hypothetical protein
VLIKAHRVVKITLLKIIMTDKSPVDDEFDVKETLIPIGTCVARPDNPGDGEPHCINPTVGIAEDTRYGKRRRTAGVPT